uniref:hypothetical protein n=1 Tax=Enterococcus faecium TaxID=1352 RepID=UPI0037BFC2E5
NVGKEIQKAFAEFFHGVNHKLMGDFVSMPMAEIERFSKMEQLYTVYPQIRHVVLDKGNNPK